MEPLEAASPCPQTGGWETAQHARPLTLTAHRCAPLSDRNRHSHQPGPGQLARHVPLGRSGRKGAQDFLAQKSPGGPRSQKWPVHLLVEEVEAGQAAEG